MYSDFIVFWNFSMEIYCYKDIFVFVILGVKF